MATAPFESRSLHWIGVSGTATIGNTHFPLERPPRVLGKVVAQVDYIPLAGVYAVMDDAHPFAWRALTPAERNYIDEKLDAMRVAGLSVWE